MIAAPAAMATAVPNGPQLGRNDVPGSRNAPKPMMHPKASAHTFSGESFLTRRSSFCPTGKPPFPLFPVQKTGIPSPGAYSSGYFSSPLTIILAMISVQKATAVAQWKVPS